ncbi:MAG: hypothetical protein COU28_00780 [Candidatus Magasanikbacteria bacterium CG10_big_fil_rev_8_21_14_0_10_36_16]|uniref:Uncharacterized protein n=1 Tax=Candidatus Magasanikbacteria bacterium CG10_big_fil_rev_8_21_14_0_10_36_16 TaxID=1974645 RepID=A0A2H0TZC4_9BACT|nr:MAG: hypothetical protein COU28_00780 [Candidatus Magasanikbacteria bacterium CG10_big_fil_rev_8_21_14_0_10_36_16]
MHSFLQKSISKKAKTNYTYNKKGRNIFFTKNIKSFYIDACHVKSSKDVHKKIFWCVPWSRQSEHQLTN